MTTTDRPSSSAIDNCKRPFKDHHWHVLADGTLVQVATSAEMRLCQDCAIRVMDPNPEAYVWRPGP